MILPFFYSFETTSQIRQLLNPNKVFHDPSTYPKILAISPIEQGSLRNIHFGDPMGLVELPNEIKSKI
jgi:hypothetical protein